MRFPPCHGLSSLRVLATLKKYRPSRLIAKPLDGKGGWGITLAPSGDIAWPQGGELPWSYPPLKWGYTMALDNDDLV